MGRARGNPDASPRAYPLPPGVMPIGISRSEAACLVGVSTTMYDAMVKDGRMPKPKRIGARTIWDRFRVEQAFRDLPGDEDSSEPKKDVWSDLQV